MNTEIDGKKIYSQLLDLGFMLEDTTTMMAIKVIIDNATPGDRGMVALSDYVAQFTAKLKAIAEAGNKRWDRT